MPLETLTGPEIPRLLAQARRRLGADAVVVSVRRVDARAGRAFEIVAADPRTAALMRPPSKSGRATARRAVSGTPAMRGEEPAVRPAAPAMSPGGRPGSASARPLARSAANLPVAAQDDPAAHWPAHLRTEVPDPAPRRAGRPLIVALVGPTGAGKTTTLAKLANHPRVFGTRRVGLICLDTYRVGAVEQSRIYGDLAGLPLEVIYEPDDVSRALKRLHACDTLLVDTAGRGPRGQGDTARTRAHLEALSPDEVHLTLPAGIQPGLARRVIEHHLSLGVTHVLPTKLDEWPEDAVAVEQAAAFGLPVRWVANGQRVPRDLESAEALQATSGVAVEVA